MQSVSEKILHYGKPSLEEHNSMLSLLADHPYSAAVHALAARSAHLRNSPSFEKAIIEAAIRAYNRKKLHDFVFSEQQEKELSNELSNINQTGNIEQKPLLKGDDLQAKKETPKSKIEAKESRFTREKQPHSFDSERISELDRQLLAEAMSAGAALDLIGGFDEPKKVNKGSSEVPSPKEAKEADKTKDAPGEESTEIPSVENLTEAVKKPTPLADKMKFSSWLSALEGIPVQEEKPAQKQPEKKPTSIADLAKTKSIIDHFIENEESLVPKRAEFFSPTKAAKSSLEDKMSLVSETLANVYTQQGNVSKAIATYEKLSLLHPEKSTYFAALIEKLKHNKLP